MDQRKVPRLEPAGYAELISGGSRSSSTRMIHALPGMGADRRMFPEPWETLAGFVPHDWPAYSGERTVADFARTVVETFEIRDGDALIGTSLGGMVACEIAKIRKLRALFPTMTHAAECVNWIAEFAETSIKPT